MSEVLIEQLKGVAAQLSADGFRKESLLARDLANQVKLAYSRRGSQLFTLSAERLAEALNFQVGQFFSDELSMSALIPNSISNFYSNRPPKETSKDDLALLAQWQQKILMISTSNKKLVTRSMTSIYDYNRSEPAVPLRKVGEVRTSLGEWFLALPRFGPSCLRFTTTLLKKPD